LPCTHAVLPGRGTDAPTGRVQQTAFSEGPSSASTTPRAVLRNGFAFDLEPPRRGHELLGAPPGQGELGVELGAELPVTQ